MIPQEPLIRYLDQVVTHRIEQQLGRFVSGIKRVSKIRGASRRDLDCYAVNFYYQTSHESSGRVEYRLIFDPEFNHIWLCREGGYGHIYEPLRQKLFERLGTEGYDEGVGREFGIYWKDRSLMDLFLT